MDNSNKLLINEIKDSISRVNLTLNDYEDDYISSSRTGNIIDREHCKNFEDYIEIRFNREALKIPIPELTEALEMTKGHLFICKELVNADPCARRFDSALIVLIDDDEASVNLEVDKILSVSCTDIIKFKSTYPEIVVELKNNLKKAISLAKSVLGKYTKFKFNSVKRKIKLTDTDGKILK